MRITWPSYVAVHRVWDACTKTKGFRMGYLRLMMLFFLCCCPSLSCLRANTYSFQDFKKCIKSAPSVMSYPTEIESLGVNSYHAIGSYQIQDKENYDWQSNVLFGTRYQISCSVPVMLNKEHTKVTGVLGEAEFHLFVIGEITDNGHAADIERDIKFDSKKWAEMIKHKDDVEKMLGVLGVQYNSDPLPLFDKLIALEMPSKEYRIRLTSGDLKEIETDKSISTKRSHPNFLKDFPTGRPTGVPGIRGGTSEPLGIGRLATLQLVNPDGKVTVVVLYPAPIDPSWYPTFSQSGNGDDISKWRAIFPIAYQGVSGTETITVQWEYSARTQKLRIGDVQVDLPKGKVGVISFDDKMKPSCEVLEKLPKAVELAKQKADREATEVEPTVEAG
jgi:hypothetical protein